MRKELEQDNQELQQKYQQKAMWASQHLNCSTALPDAPRKQPCWASKKCVKQVTLFKPARDKMFVRAESAA